MCLATPLYKSSSVKLHYPNSVLQCHTHCCMLFDKNGSCKKSNCAKLIDMFGLITFKAMCKSRLRVPVIPVVLKYAENPPTARATQLQC